MVITSRFSTIVFFSSYGNTMQSVHHNLMCLVFNCNKLMFHYYTLFEFAYQ